MPEPIAHEFSAAVDEVARLREENLRLRDQLIARDAEAGLLRGQVAELEMGAARAMHLLERMKGIVPAIVWKILSRVIGLVKRG